MRITKTIAVQVADTMTAKHKEEIKQHELLFNKMITSLVESSIPESITRLSAVHKEYFNWNNGVAIKGPGVTYQYVSLVKSLPMKAGDKTIELTQMQRDEVSKMINRYEKMQDKYESMRRRIESTLIALGTYKKVQDQFPKAYQLLPVSNVSTALVVDIRSLENEIDCTLE